MGLKKLKYGNEVVEDLLLILKVAAWLIILLRRCIDFDTEDNALKVNLMQDSLLVPRRGIMHDFGFSLNLIPMCTECSGSSSKNDRQR